MAGGAVGCGVGRLEGRGVSCRVGAGVVATGCGVVAIYLCLSRESRAARVQAGKRESTGLNAIDAGLASTGGVAVAKSGGVR